MLSIFILNCHYLKRVFRISLTYSKWPYSKNEMEGIEDMIEVPKGIHHIRKRIVVKNCSSPSKSPIDDMGLSNDLQ